MKARTISEGSGDGAPRPRTHELEMTVAAEEAAALVEEKDAADEFEVRVAPAASAET